jgi:hypothetical protein
MGGNVTPATSLTPPNGDHGNQFWKNHGRDILLTLVIALFASVALILIHYFYLAKPDIRQSPGSNVVDMIYLDASWFHKLYVRWTIIDWSLTFLATGTAISAAIKNTVSVKTDASKTLSILDILLIVSAVMTVIATTFVGKLNAAQLAEKYRYGDLHLQAARFKYAASSKGPDDIKQLVSAWQEAHSVLESSSLAPATAPPPPPQEHH